MANIADKKMDPEPSINIFTNMFSLLKPSSQSADWPSSLKLPDIFSPPVREEVRTVAKDRMLVTACPHPERKHYAKNMCNLCYHKNGRNKNAWLCPHKDRPLYAKGKCHFCYLEKYNSNLRLRRRRSRRRRS